MLAQGESLVFGFMFFCAVLVVLGILFSFGYLGTV
jgi:hypothetical protein